MDFSFLHIADMHLDRPFSGLSGYSWDEDLNKICRNATVKSFNNIIDFAAEKNVDFVLIAGDTFDSGEHDFSSKLALKRGLDKLNNAGISVYLICGNHDPLSSYSRNTFSYDENSRIKIIGLNTPACAELPLYSKSGAQIGTVHAVSFTEEKFHSNLLKNVNRAKSGFNIGLFHCDLNGDALSPYAPCSLSELKNLKYDYCALGHIHLPSNGSSNILYSGTIQGRNPKETGAHGIRYIKASEHGIKENKFIPFDTVRFEDITIDISAASDSSSAFDIIENKIEDKISKNADSAEVFLIRPLLTGCISCFSEINNDFLCAMSDRIKADFSGRVYISEAECAFSPKIDDRLLQSDTGISGEIYRTVSNKDILQNVFEKTEETISSLTAECAFSTEEYENFRNSVIFSAKEECKNICSLIYENDGETNE